jgi:hypothetical protein
MIKHVVMFKLDYATHPVHLPVVEHMRKICKSIVSVDFEIE